MKNLKELNKNEISKINGGIVWVPVAIAAGKFIGKAAAAYVAAEVVHGVAKGVAGGKYTTCD